MHLLPLILSASCSWFNLLGNHMKHDSNLMISGADEINMGQW
jgi:hypothetical protein